MALRENGGMWRKSNMDPKGPLINILKIFSPFVCVFSPYLSNSAFIRGILFLSVPGWEISIVISEEKKNGRVKKRRRVREKWNVEFNIQLSLYLETMKPEKLKFN